MLLNSILAISFGAAAGACARRLPGVKLNGLFPSVPPGTLAANPICGYVIGVAIAIGFHVGGSLAMTLLGIASWTLVR